METKLQQEINKVLKVFPKYWQGETLLKNNLIEDIRSYNEKTIEALLSNNLIKDTYALQLPSGSVFKTEDFISMLRFKKYWDNSYTKYTNEIGLTSENKYIKYNTDVVLAFPHKDCVLEGGMTQEEKVKNEVYYHNTLAKEEIDILLDPKVLTNIKKYTQEGSDEIDTLTPTDNLILKGNNLIALHSLKERYAGKVKLIYIDPPYNTGGDSFKYNDRFNHSTWLTFMKSRLEIARDLLSNDGSIWISIDDDESHYLKVLCDEIFGRRNFVSNVIWEKKFSPQNDATWLSDNHDHILVFAKNKEVWRPNLLPRTEDMDSRYKNPDNDPRGPWTSSDLTVRTYSADYDYPIKTPSGRVVHPPKGRCWNTSNERMEELISENRIWFGQKGDNVPRLKKFLSDVKGGITAKTIWRQTEVGNNQGAKREVNALEGVEQFSTPKPEKLLHRVIHLATNKNDIVLDFFMGSGTTPSVAMKMNRQYIGIEQMDYIKEVSVPRLQKVIDGEQGGISKDVDWQGGGSFVYAELYSLNEGFLYLIQSSQDKRELEDALIEIKNKAYLNFKIQLEKVMYDNSKFYELPLKEQKEVLIQMLDMNQLYLNYSEIEDSQYNISDSVKAFNHSFFQKKDDKK
ncbi:site-specific DNA-methyltransferase [Mammaliicoccus sciuri]|uniref:site-specific DNA-methyltransferase n=2 Tax=Mammaliicoccus sciuri TaxID=1296 RepID=UPI00195163D2|nr:site-specific DNA-methyltransferase [Mammaliicoccus sciuri]